MMVFLEAPTVAKGSPADFKEGPSFPTAKAKARYESQTGKPVACNCELLSMNCGLTQDTGGYYFGILGFPGT